MNPDYPPIDWNNLQAVGERLNRLQREIAELKQQIQIRNNPPSDPDLVKRLIQRVRSRRADRS